LNGVSSEGHVADKTDFVGVSQQVDFEKQQQQQQNEVSECLLLPSTGLVGYQPLLNSLSKKREKDLLDRSEALVKKIASRRLLIKSELFSFIFFALLLLTAVFGAPSPSAKGLPTHTSQIAAATRKCSLA